MKNMIVKVGDDIGEAQLVGGVTVEGQHVTAGEVLTSELFEVTDDEFKKIHKLKTNKGKLNKLDDIISNRHKEYNANT